MYRRQQFGMVDPRNVAPSRHTIFIRSLPGSMDISKVKDHFSAETNEKCSVDFFALTDDRKQLSVAIRFPSHEVAREMLSKYNGKSLFGHQVEVKWFKDLKKARAKMYEEQRQGGRQFQRSNFRNNFRSGPDHRGGQSPGISRRGRSRSSSSGGNVRGQSYRENLDKGRYSRSRSRSFTGSSSQTPSNSVRSASQSPSRARQPLRLNSSTRDAEYSANRGERTFGGRQTSRNRAQRSASRSSSTSLSSGARKRSNSGRNPDRKDRNTRSRPNPGNSPISFRNQMQHSKNLSASPEINDHHLSSYSNAPAPEFNSGSSLVSGLIQLKRRGQSNQQSSNRTNNELHRHRSSGSSSGGSPDLNRKRTNAASKRLRSFSPLDNTNNQSTKNANDLSPPVGKNSDQKRRRTRNTNRSPSSHRHDSNDSRIGRPHTPNLDHASSTSESVKQDNSGRTRRTNASKSNRASVPSEKSSTSRRTAGAQHTPEPKTAEDPSSFRDKNWSSPSVANDIRKRKPGNSSDDYDSYGSDGSDHAVSRTKQINGNEKKKALKEVNSTSSKSIEEQSKDVAENVDDSIDLIRLRKESLAQDYKRDCEAFTTVVRTLISKDADLEGRLMPMLKEILHERGQRCIEELRAYIAEHQPVATEKSSLGGQPDVLE